MPSIITKSFELISNFPPVASDVRQYVQYTNHTVIKS